MTLAENLCTKYGLTSLKTGGSGLSLTAINEALEAAAQIADRNHAPEIANQIRALKSEPTMPYASEIQTARDVA
jgi:ferritin-like protein